MFGTCFRLEEMWYKGGRLPLVGGWLPLGEVPGMVLQGVLEFRVCVWCVYVCGGGESTMWQAAEALVKVEGAGILQPLSQGTFR